jgi:hypothetical protein
VNDLKIATCCYCGRRAALVLRGGARRELACAGCGAPLSRLKPLRCGRAGPRLQKLSAPAPGPVRPPPRPPPRKRRGLLARGWEELREGLEDLVDEVLD